MSNIAQLWLVALFILWAGLLFGGFIFGKEWPDHTRRMPIWTRMASSLTLVIAAWSAWVFVEGDLKNFALLIAIGMTFGFMGDLFMAGLIPVGDKNQVLGGISAFGLGHIAYIGGLLTYAERIGLTDSSARWGAWLFWLLVGGVLWYGVVYRGREHTVLHLAALPYALLLASTAGFATGLALQSALFIPLALGAGLFLISDLILATQLFNKAYFWLISDVVWLTYGPGQMLIVFSIIFLT